MTRRKGEITRADLNRNWPYHAAIPAKKVRGLKDGALLKRDTQKPVTTTSGTT